ncbi:MFS general substrate transporter [Mycena maculata]|uniref:MFS general substrate transporter n=1 Tax=Mycena maculata TaxID=230809 RepID=A0AAD7N5U5_9AGAR|nr:MFS general substrate transporter [Mycena maculata]
MSLKLDATEKLEIEQAEYAPKIPKDVVDVDRTPGVLGYFLKKNPSPDFIADVATMNDTALDVKEIKRIERKIDWLILPALSVEEDLNLGKSEYNWLSSLFYWSTRFRPRSVDFSVGRATHGTSRNFTDIAILRTLSGAAEATADPAFVLITSTWYTRAQQPGRIAVWYCANGVGIALGGLLGFGIGHIKAPQGLPSWKYEFLIVGALYCGWAIFMYIFIPDSPYQSHWFTREERLAIASRKRDDQNGMDNRRWDSSQVIEAFVDIKTYLFFLFGFTANVPNGGTSNFGTLIVEGFGFNTFQTTLMQIPYGAIIVLLCATFPYLTRRDNLTDPFSIVAAVVANNKLPAGNRTYLMVATNIPTVVGFAMVAWAKPKAVRLIGFLRSCWRGVNPEMNPSPSTFVVGLSLVSGNVGGQTKKALSSAAIFLGVATGNIVGPFLFKESEAPTYITGVVGCMVSLPPTNSHLEASGILEIFTILALRVVFVHANKKRESAVAEGRVQYDDRVTSLQDISDWKNPAFRYVL